MKNFLKNSVKLFGSVGMTIVAYKIMGAVIDGAIEKAEKEKLLEKATAKIQGAKEKFIAKKA